MNVEQLSEKIAALVFFIAPHIINTAKHPFLFIETSLITCINHHRRNNGNRSKEDSLSRPEGYQ